MDESKFLGEANGSFDAENKNIKNIADPVDDSHAINLQFFLSGIGNAQSSIILNGNDKAYVKENSNVYTIKAYFLFRGTDILGIPTSIDILLSLKTAGSLGSVKIFDITNALSIAEINSIGTETPTIYNIGTLTNLPTGQAVFEIQLKNEVGGAGNDTYLHYMNFNF